MNDKELLFKLSELINKLEENNFIKEADSLHKQFLKFAELTDEEINEQDVSAKPIGLLPNIGGALKSIGKGIVSKPGQFLSFGLVNTLLNKGVDYSFDFFEDAQGPYNLFKNHLPDVQKINSKIKNLTNDADLEQMLNNLENELKNLLSEMESAKSTLKTAHKINFKTVYNHSFTKMAIRGEFESEAPKYLKDLIQGGTIGAGVGSLFGGVGALPGAILGALGNLGSRAIEDILYSNISDTGKAYFQAKDLNDKVFRLANSLEEIMPEKEYELKNLSERILDKTENLNLNNPNKTYIENVIRRLEKKVSKAIKPLKNTYEESKSYIGNGAEKLQSKDSNESTPFIERDYFIK